MAATRADHVLMDNAGGARLLCEHLLDLGRRNIAFVGVENDPISRARLEGIKAVHRERGLPFDDAAQVVDAPFWQGCHARHVLPRWLDKHPLPDAIIAVSVRTAAGTLRVLQERGARVPDDVALVCFGDSILSREMPLPLTVVAPPLYQLGATCMQRLIARLDGADSRGPVIEVLPCQLNCAINSERMTKRAGLCHKLSSSPASVWWS